MKIEPVIRECHSNYNIVMPNGRNQMIIKYSYFCNFLSFNKLNDCAEIKIDENVVNYETFNVLISDDEYETHLCEILNYLKSIENDNETCEVIISSHTKCYRINGNYEDIDCFFVNFFSDSKFEININNTIKLKTQDGILLLKEKT